MASVFVDANILLGFWSARDGRVPSELLLALVEYGEHVLVTQQLVDEVNRRKLAVFLENKGKFSVASPPLIPDHMVKERAHAAANDAVRDLEARGKDAIKAWEAACSEIAASISDGSDLTSGMLEPLFKRVVAPTPDQLEAARTRRERGNPPGKRSDTLGDQISWEQFLSAAAGEDKVWLVTQDGDFAVKDGACRLLNPVLYAELKGIGVNQVELHDGLAGAIKAMKAAGLEIGAKISNEQLDELEKAEVSAFVPRPPYLIWPDGAWQCPACNSLNKDTPLIPHPSQYGGWSYWTGCTHCGSQLDTGEAYDD